MPLTRPALTPGAIRGSHHPSPIMLAANGTQRMKDKSSSFHTRKINGTTFVIREDDGYGEHPLIYAKIHPNTPVLVLVDTGCDEPSDKHENDRFTRLRDYLENCPIECNNNKPLNPGGPPDIASQQLLTSPAHSYGLRRSYIVIFTHCHYDHTGGITQFLAGGTTEVIASSAGRDFIESDLATHGLFKYLHIPVPYFTITHWADSFERLQIPFDRPSDDDDYYDSTAEVETVKKTDLDISIIHTPGHTPDELAVYDHAERHLLVGDSFYEGVIIFPPQGNLIEYVFSMQKLAVFVRGENARLAEEVDGEEWVMVAPRVKVSAAHETAWVDGEKILADLEKFSARVYEGSVPIVKKEYHLGEAYFTWKEDDSETEKGSSFTFTFMAPARLMDQARKFFGLHAKDMS